VLSQAEPLRSELGQARWPVSMTVPHGKSGSAWPLRVFLRMIRDMAKADRLPEYCLTVEQEDLVRVTLRNPVIERTGLISPPEAIEPERAATPEPGVHRSNWPCAATGWPAGNRDSDVRSTPLSLVAPAVLDDPVRLAPYRTRQGASRTGHMLRTQNAAIAVFGKRHQ
jgi:hypothetical protein